MQLVQLIGYLGRDPETKYTKNGNTVTSFSVAVGETWKDRSGDKQERTEWFNIESWGKLAEICETYLHKGAQVYIRGKNVTSEWEDDAGKTRYTTRVRADDVQFLKTDRDYKKAPAQTANGKLEDPTPEDFEDDIPF